MLDDDTAFTPLTALHQLTHRRTTMATPRFDPSSLTNAANESFTVRRVFGEAYERAGTLVIPVARVWGATGSGSGGGEMAVPHHGEDGAEEKARRARATAVAGGYATHVKAVGVFVVDDDRHALAADPRREPGDPRRASSSGHSC